MPLIILYILLGYRKLDFTTDDGNAVKGTQLFVRFPEDGVTGEMCDKLFVRDGVELPALTPGMTLDISFNRKGKVAAVKVAIPAKS